jgi:hypothetical protein
MDDLLADGSYVAGMYMPLADMTNVLEYINKELTHLCSKMKLEFDSSPKFTFFTLPVQLWKNGKWTLEVKRMREAIRVSYLRA